MQTECVRCHKIIDTVQGYKFSATEYVCMVCYDEYKAERTARAKKQHKNPLIDQFGTEGGKPAARQAYQRPAPKPGPAAPQADRESDEPVVTDAPPKPIPAQPVSPRVQAPPAREQAPEKPAVSQAASSEDICDVCKQALSGFKVPLKGGGKVCMTCNDILRGLAKNLILNIQCPHCGKEIQLSDL